MIRVNDINISFDKVIIENGELIAHAGSITGISGISGSGKSSLLDKISLLTYRGEFDYQLDNEVITNYTEKQLNKIQKTRISYLRQKCTFLSTMKCLENVILESEMAGHRISEKEAMTLLETVHLEKKANVYPSKLSGGEEQRLAIAMSLAKNADIIICDEITSMLDEENTHEVINLLISLAHKENKTVIIATHEEDVINCVDCLYVIEDKTLKLVKEYEINETLRKKKRWKK